MVSNILNKTRGNIPPKKFFPLPISTKSYTGLFNKCFMKIGIIGSGFVGSATAFRLITGNITHEVILVDIDKERAAAEAIDIQHAAPTTSGGKIYSGDYDALQNAGIIIFTAGANQKPGQTRLDLLKINAKIFSEIVPKVLQFAPDAIMLVASNPLDIMTEIVLKLSKLPTSRVIGSGTVLDSARFITQLSEHLNISSQSIDAYVIGEHGDSEVLVWSQARVGTLDITEYAKQTGKQLTNEIKATIDDNVRNAAYKIIAGKKATFYGIAGALGAICEAIITNSSKILPVSSHHDTITDASNICLAMPTIINATGIVKVIHPQLSSEEYTALTKSAAIIEDYTQKILSEI